MGSFFKTKINIEKIMAFLAFVVSICTLYLFFHQTSLMRKQQYASVLPYLEVGNTENNGNYGFVLNNNGIGPAFIEEINIHYKDSVYRNTDINDFYVKVMVKQDTLFKGSTVFHSTIRKGMLVPEREVKYMLGLRKEVKNFEILHQQLREWLNNKIRVEIKYSSVYKEKWRIIYPGQDTPEKIK
ncbi:hypothetical protein GWK08_15770 [Leptobacterium flavescens]|uniref:Uncharacterized protein n=1 Tax=Leptobacterium flavescens TaxID=472055 RepID=A0A6P0UNM8_9FLAO|nr:hypothetical protein [Leptobacterium flavescens]NER14914.1 hypothetical protein [Leptobacterium flavescens]